MQAVVRLPERLTPLALKRTLRPESNLGGKRHGRFPRHQTRVSRAHQTPNCHATPDASAACGKNLMISKGLTLFSALCAGKTMVLPRVLPFFRPRCLVSHVFFVSGFTTFLASVFCKTMVLPRVLQPQSPFCPLAQQTGHRQSHHSA